MNHPSGKASGSARLAILVLHAAGLLTTPGCRTASDSKTSQATPPPVKQAPSTQPTNAVSVRANEAQTGWTNLFDGRTLTGWAVTDFAGRGDVMIEDGRMILEMGIMTGVNWTNEAALPRLNYEIALDAMRVDGSDFFCGLTFPVGEDPCSLIVGGWGGGVVGLSSLDGQDASSNETTKYMNFENGRWFAVRVRVTGKNISVWIDNDKVVDADTEGRRVSIRPEVEASKPLGIATWSTKAALRNIRLSRL